MTLACSTIVLASAVKPDMAHPICESISMIFSIELDSSRGDWTRFSTPRTTPSLVWMPTVVDPSCGSRQRMRQVVNYSGGSSERLRMPCQAGTTHLDGFDGIFDCGVNSHDQSRPLSKYRVTLTLEYPSFWRERRDRPVCSHARIRGHAMSSFSLGTRDHVGD